MFRRLYLAWVLGALALLAAPGWISAEAEERAGAQILRSVEDGERPCGTLRTRDYERVGEYAMGRMVGSPGVHESMDRLMAQMMGELAEGRMHVLMGRRFSGCGGGRVPDGFGGMMSMMGMMGGGFGPAERRGLDYPGGGPGAGRFPGMMDRLSFVDEDNHDDGWGAAAIVMTVLVLLFLALAVAALLLWRPWRHAGGGTSSLQILEERFARGEIDSENYRRRREALGG